MQSIFRLHVFNQFRDLADLKASEVKARDLREVLAKLVNAGKVATAGKLRSATPQRRICHSGGKAEFDPTAPAKLLIGFGIEANPCDVLPSMAQFNVAGERTLTEEELGLYLNGIDFFPLMTQRAMRLAIYLGGQRPTHKKTTALHILPLVGIAREVVGELMKLNEKARSCSRASRIAICGQRLYRPRCSRFLLPWSIVAGVVPSSRGRIFGGPVKRCWPAWESARIFAHSYSVTDCLGSRIATMTGTAMVTRSATS
ncbi:MAG: hypothetical protein IPJ38_15635 [Dechloromonas sp.]|uniref:Uncharacterized protein n=1 Tax=Candidatus Dechloromonas phosphorivorans TaxID=2899244 RepID=A0A935N274_9RHOO|nr:hypothetical protein [Candidatus Dechloromonas phosphorivorans]